MARLIAAFAAGAAFNLGFAPFGWWPLALLAPAALFALIRGLPPRRAGWTGAAFGLGLFAFGTYWLYTCLHVFGLVPVWLTLLLQAALIAAMSLYLAALCYLANRFWLKARRDAGLVGAAGAVGVARMAARMAAQRLPVAVARLCNDRLALGGLGAAVRRLRRDLGGGVDRGGDQRGVHAGRAAGAARLGARRRRLDLFLVPALLACHGRIRPELASAVAAVQGAVSQDQKWQAKNRELTMQRYLKLTGQAWGARLIIWPEASLPVCCRLIFRTICGAQGAGTRARRRFCDRARSTIGPQTKQYLQWHLGAERRGRRLVLQAAFGAVRRILPGARPFVRRGCG